MPHTSCTYVLFHERHHQRSLRETVVHVLKQLYRRRGGDLRKCADSILWLAHGEQRPFWKEWRDGKVTEIAPRLWVWTQNIDRMNIESYIRDVLCALNYQRTAFRIVAFNGADPHLSAPL